MTQHRAKDHSASVAGISKTGSSSRRKNKPDQITPAVYTLGLVADTHIPDRVSALHPRLLPMLEAAGVTHILHAGDICAGRVLKDLATVAPVTAVRGNRDIFNRGLPMRAELELGGVRVVLIHGHGGWLPYLWDKIFYFRDGYVFKRYLPRLLHEMGEAEVIVYGHTHFPEIIHREGQLIINPGSASFGPKRRKLPSFGLLRIDETGRISAEICRLDGWKIENHAWVER